MTKIETGKGTRNIGTYHESVNRFISCRNSDKHLFKKMDAWALDASYLDFLVDKNATIEIRDQKEEKKYLTTAKQMKEKGNFLHFKGHNAQVFLPRKEWTTRHFGQDFN